MLSDSSQDRFPWNNSRVGLSKSCNQLVNRRSSDGNFRFVQRFILAGTDQKHISDAPSPRFATLNSCEFPCNWHVFVNSFPRLWEIMQGHSQHLQHKSINRDCVTQTMCACKKGGRKCWRRGPRCHICVSFVPRPFDTLLNTHTLPFVARIKDLLVFKVHAVIWMVTWKPVPTDGSWDESTVPFSLAW